MNSLKFTLPVPPSVNKAYDMKILYYGRKATASRFLTNEAVKFKERASNIIKKEMKKNNITFLTNNKYDYLELNMDIFMNRKHRDSDNLLKLVQDSIVKSGAIPDDSNILVKMNGLYIDAKNPRIEIELKLLNKIGIFENIEQKKEFEIKNCHKCKKNYYKKPCGKYKKIINNYINDIVDLQKMECLKIKKLGE